MIPAHFRYLPSIITACLGLALFIGGVDDPQAYAIFTFFLILSGFFLTLHKGFVLDPRVFEYKVYTGLFGMEPGQWMGLPEIRQIYIYRTSTAYEASFRGYFSYGSISATTVLVVMFTAEDKKILVATASGKKEALQIAMDLNGYLNTTICDHTGRERVYHEPVPKYSAT